MKNMTILDKITKKHFGKFVATTDFSSTNIIAYAETPTELEQKLRKKGYYLRDSMHLFKTCFINYCQSPCESLVGGCYTVDQQKFNECEKKLLCSSCKYRKKKIDKRK